MRYILQTVHSYILLTVHNFILQTVHSYILQTDELILHQLHRQRCLSALSPSPLPNRSLKAPLSPRLIAGTRRSWCPQTSSPTSSLRPQSGPLGTARSRPLPQACGAPAIAARIISSVQCHASSTVLAHATVSFPHPHPIPSSTQAGMRY